MVCILPLLLTLECKEHKVFRMESHNYLLIKVILLFLFTLLCLVMQQGFFYDHRLPRVHRGLAYETAVPSAGGYSHHSQRHLPTHINSQHFQSNSLNRSAFGAVPPLSADYRNQPHYSSLPLRNEYTNHMFEGGNCLVSTCCTIHCTLDNWRVKKLKSCWIDGPFFRNISF